MMKVLIICMVASLPFVFSAPVETEKKNLEEAKRRETTLETLELEESLKRLSGENKKYFPNPFKPPVPQVDGLQAEGAVIPAHIKRGDSEDTAKYNSSNDIEGDLETGENADPNSVEDGNKVQNDLTPLTEDEIVRALAGFLQDRPDLLRELLEDNELDEHDDSWPTDKDYGLKEVDELTYPDLEDDEEDNGSEQLRPGGKSNSHDIQFKSRESYQDFPGDKNAHVVAKKMVMQD